MYFCSKGVLPVRESELREGDLVIVYLRPPPVTVRDDKAGTDVTVPRKEVKPVFGIVLQSQKYGRRHNDQLHPLVG